MMKNKYLRLFSIIGLVVAATCLSISCEVEDGVNGTDGIDGADGADGTDGANGIGLNDLVKYGSINLTMTGNRPDDDSEFSYESELRFLHNEPGNNDVYYPNIQEAGKTEYSLGFYITRFLNSPDADEASSVQLYLDVFDEGLESQDFEFGIYFEDFYILLDDLNYIEFDEESYENDDEGVSNFEISDYSFDETTNNLIFSFTFDIDEEYNRTNNDLTISGTVDVIVFEDIGSEENFIFIR